MKKLNYAEFERAMREFNSEHGIVSQADKRILKGVIVFTKDSFDKEYSEVQRSYKTNNLQKAWLPNMISNSIFADCIDGSDNGVRVDLYMYNDKSWKVDYCYLIEN
ncbi:MAG: hypothetical protein IKW51_08680 [Bacteroidales bacterium]|nr:hypothetical protein [Bacteroidales bacterium]